ncbi:hypothetical protein COV04_01945 [Candidatus Uhrbacteria bacterium CG10_big_fil_rev_8_21_14_0_10_48_11]|uniref:Uncharacterized protein n=1 Tax=Candidatus Uhrbacteria bacterium CG10_big_fil_rev_8_21_14_0_10_48_11 TaxID=1975037 RepID=A0A2M8LEW0_9BACT|nr:MAG: hypothetical protein COV04_01945 [Candidatus Uhrbacteria bacterium CG10_big_fil_rev_8_21_14_0_10_48_11]
MTAKTLETKPQSNRETFTSKPEVTHEQPRGESAASERLPIPATTVQLGTVETAENSAAVKSQSLQEIEEVLTENLSEVYAGLSPKDRFIVKTKGEETAFKIRMLLRQASVKFYSIFQLVISWLKAIPGLNRPFIEQEAKLKADQLLRMRGKRDL